MGLDIKRFSGDVDEDFHCPICQDIIEDPIACQSEHIFCKSCIDEWLQTSSSCPVDRQPLNNSELIEPPRFFRNCYAKLVLKCEFDLHGCSINCKIEDVVSHQNKCDFNPYVKLKCEKGCDALLSRDETAEHNCTIYLNSIIQKLKEDSEKSSRKESEQDELARGLQSMLSKQINDINELKQKIKLQPKPTIVQIIRPSARTMVLNQADPPRSLGSSTRSSHRGGSHAALTSHDFDWFCAPSFTTHPLPQDGESQQLRYAQTHGGHQRGAQTHRGHQRGAQTHGGHEIGAQTHGGHQRGAQTHGGHQRGAQTHGSHEIGAQTRGGHQRGAQTHGGHQRGAQTHGGHEIGAQTHGGHQRGAQTHRGHQRGAQTHGGHEIGAQTHGGHQRGAQTRGGHQRGAQAHGGHQRGAQTHGSHLKVAEKHEDHKRSDQAQGGQKPKVKQQETISIKIIEKTIVKKKVIK